MKNTRELEMLLLAAVKFGYEAKENGYRNVQEAQRRFQEIKRLHIKDQPVKFSEHEAFDA